MEQIRVVVADDHPFVRIGIRKILSRTRDIVVIGEAQDGEQALKVVADLEPDVLLLDVEMPRLNGIQVAMELQRAASPVRVLVLSAYEDRQHVLGMLDAGVNGYLTKEEVPDTLVKAVRGVATGKRGWVSKRLAEKLSKWKNSSASGILFLTPRQREVLSLAVEEKSHAEIASKLGVSEEIVSQQLETLYAQLDVRSLDELAVRAREQQLV